MYKKLMVIFLLGALGVGALSAKDLTGRIGIGIEPPKLSFRYWLSGFALDAQLGILNLVAPEGQDMAVYLGTDFILPLVKEKRMHLSGVAGIEIQNLTGDKTILIPLCFEAEYFPAGLQNLAFTLKGNIVSITVSPDVVINLGFTSFPGFGFHYYF